MQNPQDLINKFEENGYLVLRSAVQKTLIDKVLQDIDHFKKLNANNLTDTLNERNRMNRVVNLHLALPSIIDLFTKSTSLLAFLDRYFGKKTSIYTSLFFEEGSQQAIHVDSPYFATRPNGRYCGVWIALEDADETNGCLVGIPHGHKAGHPNAEAIARRYYNNLNEIPDGDQRLWDDYQQEVVEGCAKKGLHPESIRVRKGDVVIWHSGFPHGGNDYEDKALSRRSVVFHVIPQGESVYHMDVFFNPAKSPLPKFWPFVRGTSKRAYFIAEQIDMGHKKRIPLTDLILNAPIARKAFHPLLAIFRPVFRKLFGTSTT